MRIYPHREAEGRAIFFDEPLSWNGEETADCFYPQMGVGCCGGAQGYLRYFSGPAGYLRYLRYLAVTLGGRGPLLPLFPLVPPPHHPPHPPALLTSTHPLPMMMNIVPLLLPRRIEPKWLLLVVFCWSNVFCFLVCWLSVFCLLLCLTSVVFVLICWLGVFCWFHLLA